MLITTLLAVLAQTAPPLVASEKPSPEPVPEDLQAFSAFVDRHLLSVTAQGDVKNRTRTFKLADDDFETAFALVPEAVELAHRAHQDAAVATHFRGASLALMGASAGVVLVTTLLPTLLVPLLVGSMIGLLVALAVSLVALPLAASAQERFVNAVSTHNHGLLDLRTAAGQRPFGGVTVSF